MSNCRWQLRPVRPPGYGEDYPALLAQLLFNRGISEDNIIPFLVADERLCHDPFLLLDMDLAIERLNTALLRGEAIAVYGDFDTDGVTATTLLVEGLAALGASVSPYIPQRLKEGYGLNASALARLRQDGVSLVISVDCGITALSEVEAGKALGLDFIITDHHLPLENLPQATAVIDPKRTGSAYPCTELAGVGVAYKLLAALYQSLDRSLPESVFDLVALGTVADMVPLTGENRYLVVRGLERLNASPRPGIKEMTARLNTPVTTETISWMLAPRLNAAGRLGDAMVACRLLSTSDAGEARALAAGLETENTERQLLTSRFLGRAREKVLAEALPPLLIYHDAECPPGISGLVAGRLAEEFYRPSVVISVGAETSTASCRSIPEFNITAAVARCAGWLSRFGGHARAAGFSLPTGNLEGMTRQLTALATEQLAGLDLQPCLVVDAETSLDELDTATIQALRRLEPCGEGNPVPTFVSRGLTVLECRTIGNAGEHLRLRLKQNDTTWEAVAFRAGALGQVSSPVDIVYNLELDHWQGRDTLRLNILDLVPAHRGAAP